MMIFFFSINYFVQFFGFFGISLLQNKLMKFHIADDIRIFYFYRKKAVKKLFPWRQIQ